MPSSSGVIASSHREGSVEPIETPEHRGQTATSLVFESLECSPAAEATRDPYSASTTEDVAVSAKEQEPTVFEAARLREDREGMEERRGASSGCCRQLGITLRRTILLQSREPCAWACELLIPIIFVAGSIALWAIFGNDTKNREQFFHFSNVATSQTLFQNISSLTCYDDTVVTSLEDLPSCTNLLAATASLDLSNEIICADPITGAPTGLCAMSEALQLAYYGWQYVVNNATAVIPTLDELIPMQWLCRMYYQQLGIKDVMPNTRTAAMTSSGSLYFSPVTTEVTDLADYLTAKTKFFKYVFKGTMSVGDVEEKLSTRRSSDPPNWGYVVFNSFTSTDFDVSIRVNASAIPRTKRPVAKPYIGGVVKDNSELYIYSGFATLQTTIYDYYFSAVLGAASTPPPTVAVPTPNPKTKQQKFLSYGGQLCPLILVLGFLYPVSQMTKRIVVEKELRLREAMLIMGLTEIVMYSSWLIVNVVQSIVQALIIAILLKATYVKDSNFGIIFFLFLFFCISLISLSALIAAFFSHSRLAAILSPIIFFALSIPLFAMRDTGGGAKAGVSLLSPSGLAVGIGILFDYELAGGMHGKDITGDLDSPNMLVVMLILVVDFFLYGILLMYFDAVLPKEWGTRKNPFFCIIAPFRWCFCRKKDGDYDNDADGRAEDGVFEEIEDVENSAIRIVGLRKEFGSRKKKFVAVNDFHWAMKEGEISVLLGHNGAGKTTTMNMMTGMIAADKGDCYIYGNSVRHDLAKARREIGYCPQHNILWPLLTVREHLWYYSSIKGLRGEDRETYINFMVQGVDLQDKIDYRSNDLSGGQKRKLSVAIAFVGGSRLIFLDEPTAGMDVGARRHTWGLLRKLSNFHSILLTTHFMDEADLLGDTIAIMHKGRLHCSGSNMFLKSKLGLGYVLTLSVVAHVNREPINQLIQGAIPSAVQLGSGAGEAAFRLPMSDKSAFPGLLASIEERGSNMGINAFSLSATTLEEIFIQIAKDAGEIPAGNRGATNSEPSMEGEGEGERATLVDEGKPSDVWNVELMDGTCAIMWSQLKAMLLKRFWSVLRDRRTQFFQIVCPVACVLLAMLLMLVKFFDYPSLNLVDGVYETDVEYDVGNCGPVMDLTCRFAHQTLTYEPPGVTTALGMSNYLLTSYKDHPVEEYRYGAMACSDASAGGMTALFYNTSAYHQVPLNLYFLYNGYYMKNQGACEPRLTTYVATMPQTKAEKDLTDAVYAMVISIIIMIPFTFIPSTFVAWVVREWQCKARHLQNVSGLFFSIYWTANYIFDMLSYLITMFLVIIVFVIFQRTEYIGKDAIGATIVLFLLYGLSGVSMAYALSFLFNDHSTAQNTVMLSNFIAGFLLVLCIAMLSMIDSTEDAADVLRYLFRVVPSYCVGEGIMNLAVLKMNKAFGTTKTAWSMSVIGWPCVYMAIEIPFFIFITLFIDHPGRRQRTQRAFHNPDAEPEHVENEDEDVVREREEVFDDPERLGDLVRVTHLRKKYKNGKVAVRDITFGVKPGEVFGFLGTNGAGKTTTISILCQEFYPTSGHGAICGYDIVNNSRQALRCIGYCPQFDATLELLTVKEHLELYAGVRGIQYDQRERVVKGLMSLCELTDYKSTLSKSLSGGNRRKLSVALSLIGGPRVVFLDEPSAGMDPVARRGLWTAIETVADNCSIVLTTHHLEEVEALAHRVAIMVDGVLECIGNKTHLKRKYGSGFEVNVRIAKDDEEIRRNVEDFFAAQFPESSIREYRARRYTFALPAETVLSQTFQVLEENVDSLGVVDYSVSQTSIEQVFLRISEEAEKKAEEEHANKIAAKKKCCSCCC